MRKLLLLLKLAIISGLNLYGLSFFHQGFNKFSKSRNVGNVSFQLATTVHLTPKEEIEEVQHDDVRFRSWRGESFIPQAERYSTKDWWHNLKTIRTSRLLRRIRRVITVNTLWSIAVCIFYKFFKFQSPGSRAHSLLGGALGLLLVFRTNTAYDRYWEGRKIWERLLSSLRDMGRMTVIYSDVMSSTQLQRILHLLIAFPIVLQEYVQGCRQPTQLRDLLIDDEMQEIDVVTNRPFFIVNRLAKEVRKITDSTTFTSRERERMFKVVDEISRSISCCERIVQTPVPLTYARHTSRFLALWCLTLPPCLVTEIGWWVVPFTAFVSWSLFGIQEIGSMIEEPFQKALKLEVFANTIRRDLSELIHIAKANVYPVEVESNQLKYERPSHLSTQPPVIPIIKESSLSSNPISLGNITETDSAMRNPLLFPVEDV